MHFQFKISICYFFRPQNVMQTPFAIMLFEKRNMIIVKGPESIPTCDYNQQDKLISDLCIKFCRELYFRELNNLVNSF